jgi:PadR family transcriptional regulator PadR
MTYQLTAPLLDACVLGILAKGDAYGYTLTQKVRELVDISESTLYPVLRRLQKDGLLLMVNMRTNCQQEANYLRS